jgi:Rps23 Pro-64 3,4-dihydroxylase Tpa1-like proline 4-hydroxylase
MNVELYTDPIPHLILTDVFEEELADSLFKDALKHKDKFNDTTIGINKRTDNVIRNNKALFLDSLYPKNERDGNLILSTFDKLLRSDKFVQILSSSPQPINDYMFTNTHETQISMYGSNQKYDWHVDGFNKKRQVTIVYYFKDSGKWNGGEILLSNSPIYNSKLMIPNPKIKKIKPIPNSIVVFGGYAAHSVNNTNTSDKFEECRFSANIWVGVV